MREEKQYPMSSESEWSCRVEGSGSQCNVLIQPNHQSVLVRERETGQAARKRKPGGRNRKSEPHHRRKRWKERQREWRIKTERVLIQKRAGAKAKETFGIFTANRQQRGTDPIQEFGSELLMHNYN